MTVSVAEGRRDSTRRPAPAAAVAGSMFGTTDGRSRCCCRRCYRLGFSLAALGTAWPPPTIPSSLPQSGLATQWLSSGPQRRSPTARRVRGACGVCLWCQSVCAVQQVRVRLHAVCVVAAFGRGHYACTSLSARHSHPLQSPTHPACIYRVWRALHLHPGNDNLRGPLHLAAFTLPQRPPRSPRGRGRACICLHRKCT